MAGSSAAAPVAGAARFCPNPVCADVANGVVGLCGAAAAAGLAITLPNSRTSETEADRIGIELAAKAGYDPRAAATLWEKMGKAGGNGPPQFLSTHPAPQNRQATLKALENEMMPYYEAPGPRPVYKLKPLEIDGTPPTPAKQ